MSTHRSDVVIVGAGIIGLAHATLAHEAGLTVTVLERDSRAVGASVRNFGHVCTSAQPRTLQPLAQLSRAGWLRVAERAAIPVRTDGCVTLARTATQLRVLEELAAERGEQVHLLTPDAARARLGGLGAADLVGGAWLRDDLRVDPRTTVARLAAWLEESGAAQVRWRHPVTAIAPAGDGHVVHTPRGDFHADRVIVCVGHDLDQLYPQVSDDHEIARCRLSMGRTRSGTAVDIAPAVLTGTSMARYGAFVEQPSGPALLAELQQIAAPLLAIDANVMATQLPDGSLIVGDSHDDDLVAPPFMSEDGYRAILADLGEVLAIADLDVVERWQGVYATSPKQDVVHHEVRPGLELVTVTSGIGMTLSFGIAARTFGAEV